ncbi:MAG: NAD(+) diphosphatase [Novosphingobium sp.]
MKRLPITFAGSPLDRADHLRGDAQAITRLMDHRARLLLLNGLDPVIGDDGALVWGSLAAAEVDTELTFLGLLEGRACFATVPEKGSVSPPGPGLWQAATSLSAEEIAIYGTARALVSWHARHRFCAVCGGATVLAKGGWQRTCTGETCRAEHFPRTDPVTIMLVEHANDSGGNLLLGRQPRFPPRRFSALAGFVEPGETIEEAVAREVFEEAGVRVRDVSYVASQPWPFPSSLMIGCHAFADDPAITVDTTELEEALWFTRDEVAAAMAGDESGRFIAPPRMAIANLLLGWWLGQG